MTLFLTSCGQIKRKTLSYFGRQEAAEVVNEEHWHEIEIMMSDFGLNVIWFNEFEELPKIINYISGVSKEKPDVA